MKHVERCAGIALLLCGLAGLVLLPQEAAQGAREGLKLCGGGVIPALFPFFVLSSMAVSLGAAAGLGRLLSPVMGPLFRAGDAAAGALALGLLGGYPVGAQTVRQLYESGQCTKREAERLLAFCNNCGPAFILGVAGAGVFGSPVIGGILLAGHWLGALSVGVLFRFYGTKGESRQRPCPVQCTSLSRAFTSGVSRGLGAAGSVCAYVVLFAVLLKLLEAVGAMDRFAALPGGRALFSGLLELTGGITQLSPGSSASVVLAAFLMGLGGLSVLCQSLAVLDGSGLDTRPMAAGKLLHGALAAGWTKGLLRCFPRALETLAAGEPQMAKTGWHWLPLAGTAVCWGIFCLILWYFIAFHSSKREKRRV